MPQCTSSTTIKVFKWNAFRNLEFHATKDAKQMEQMPGFWTLECVGIWTYIIKVYHPQRLIKEV
jgi:hypothetical protein